MNVKPILMSAPMILALLREIEAPGTGKTQTRRIIKPQPLWVYDNKIPVKTMDADPKGEIKCPYGKPGDLLYVRETYAEVGTCDPGWLLYRASGYKNECRRHAFDQYPDESAMKWTPSIHMPRHHSRLTLEITDIRVERLQSISEADAKAEGAEKDDDACDHKYYSCDEIGCLGPTFKCGFADLWCSINGDDSWRANPWVWAVTFTPHLINVDQFIREMV